MSIDNDIRVGKYTEYNNADNTRENSENNSEIMVFQYEYDENGFIKKSGGADDPYKEEYYDKDGNLLSAIGYDEEGKIHYEEFDGVEDSDEDYEEYLGTYQKENDEIEPDEYSKYDNEILENIYSESEYNYSDYTDEEDFE